MKRLSRTLLVVTLVLWLVPVASAELPKPGSSENLITMNFQDVDISVLAKFISEITGKNFVLDESVRGKVSIVSPTKVTPEQAYSIFKSVLQLKGFTTVGAGPVIKIVPSRDVRGSAALTQSQTPAQQETTDAYVTRMVKLRNVDSASLVNVIQPMISRDGLVAAFPETNTLIITDDAWNVQRLLSIIGSLDSQGIQQSVAVIPLKLAYADDLAPKIEQIMGERASGAAGTPGYGRPGMGVVAPSAQAPSRAFKIVPDQRTNSLIVLAGPLQMRQIKDLVDKLDIHSPSATSRVHVYYLKYAQSLQMVAVLNALLGGGGGGPGMLSPQTGRGSLGRGSGLGFGGLGTGGMGGGFGGMGGYGGGFGSMSGGMGGGFGGMGGGFGGMGGMGGGMGGFGGGMRNRASGSLGGGGAASAMATGGPGTEFEQPVRVTADPATNSLVVSASPQDFATLQTIISQLDIPRRQVYVQAVIVEVSTNRMRELGISYQGSANFGGNVLGVGHFDYGNLASALTNPLGATGLTFGLASGSMCTVNTALSAAAGSTTSGSTTSTNVTVPCDIALITAIETDTHSNVLSAPTLLTTDNEEATIVVGQNLPFLSSATASSALTGQIFQSVNRQNVGITLDIVPQITEGGYIKLDVYEEVSAVILSTVNNPLGPTTTIRSASTTVLVQNHRTTVIGGLLADGVDISRNGVPFLSNIPVLGNFFTDRQRNGQKTDLMVFLTPHVILNREDLRELSLDERQRFLQTLGRKEVHDMPLAQVREIFKPSFSVSVPPGAEFGAPNPQPDSGAGFSAPGAAAPSGAMYAPPPPNTYEIAPGARNSSRSGASAPVAIAPAGPLAGAPPAAAAPVGAAPATYSSAPAPGSVQAEAGTHKSSGTLDSVKGLFDLR
jgi:general secretion pathway protein D